MGRILTVISRGAIGIAGAGGSRHSEAIDAARTLAYDAHVADMSLLGALEGVLPPMKCSFRFLNTAALLLLSTNFCVAQQQPAPQAEKATEKPKEEKKPPVPEEKVVQTKHSLKIGGQEIKYKIGRAHV